MAMRRLLALAAAATVAADVVQVAVLCNYIEARIADRQDCDAIIAAVDAINDKEDGVLDGLLPDTILNLTLAFEGCGDSHPDTGLGDDAFEVWKALPIQPVAAIGPACSSSVKAIASVAAREQLGSNAVIISEASTSTSISDRDEYPNVVRLAMTPRTRPRRPPGPTCCSAGPASRRITPRPALMLKQGPTPKRGGGCLIHDSRRRGRISRVDPL